MVWDEIENFLTFSSRIGKLLYLHRLDWLKRLKKRVELYLGQRPIEMVIDGFTIFVPRYIRRFEDREFYSICLFSEAIQPGSTVLDVGANVGYYTLLASRLVGAQGHVYAIEPDPRNLQFLTKNLRANRCVNVDVLPFAISDRSGLMTLYLDIDPTETSLTYQQRRSKAIVGSLDVECVSIDELCEKENIQKVDVIKMDIEGGEFKALLGAKETFRKNNVTLLIEFLPAVLKESGITSKEFIGLLEDMGFEPLLIHEKERVLLQNPLEFVDNDGKIFGEIKGNLLCHKKNR